MFYLKREIFCNIIFFLANHDFLLQLFSDSKEKMKRLFWSHTLSRYFVLTYTLVNAVIPRRSLVKKVFCRPNEIQIVGQHCQYCPNQASDLHFSYKIRVKSRITNSTFLIHSTSIPFLQEPFEVIMMCKTVWRTNKFCRITF